MDTRVLVDRNLSQMMAPDAPIAALSPTVFTRSALCEQKYITLYHTHNNPDFLLMLTYIHCSDKLGR